MSDDAKKIEFLGILSDVELRAQSIEMAANETAQAARFTRDVAGPLKGFMSEMPSKGLTIQQWDDQIRNWQLLQQGATQVQGGLTTVNSFAALAQSAAMSASGSISVGMQVPLSSVQQSRMAECRTQLFQTFGRSPLVAQAKASMARLGLLGRGGGRPPEDLLEEAQAAMQQPLGETGGAVAVLIPLRESILAVLAELIRPRAVQEKTPGYLEKIQSLGRHCGRSSLPGNYFDQMGADCEKLINELSGVKQANIERWKLEGMFNSGLLFLNSLLNSIDEGKLR